MVRIADVAERAGVSTMSVSRVLNNSPLATDEMRRRVQTAIAALNYVPSSAARSLKRGRTALLGVLIPNTNNPIYGLYVDGIKDVAYRSGLGVLLCKSSNAPEVDAASLQLLLEHRVTGLIATSPLLHEHEVLLRIGAMVTIDHRLQACDAVTLDNFGAMRLAVAHLAGLGHEAIGVIAGPLTHRSERERLVGFRRAMKEFGLPVTWERQRVAGGWEDADGIAAGQLLAGPDRPTAVVVTSSTVTPGVLAAAAALGLRVPGDVALVGVGELSWSPLLVSPVTSLVEPAYEMGAAACTMVLERVAGTCEEPPRRRFFTPRLAVRLSCGAPPEQRDTAMRGGGSLLFCGPDLAAVARAGHQDAGTITH